MPDHTGTSLSTACTEVAGELTRTDTKAALLAAFVGAVFAGLTGVAQLIDRTPPLPAQLAAGAAVLALSTAAVLLLLVVRPNLASRRRPAREGFPLWAHLTEGELRAAVAEDTRAARLRSLSVIALTKYRRLTRAVDMILTALGLLVAAAVLWAVAAVLQAAA